MVTFFYHLRNLAHKKSPHKGGLRNFIFFPFIVQKEFVGFYNPLH